MQKAAPIVGVHRTSVADDQRLHHARVPPIGMGRAHRIPHRRAQSVQVLGCARYGRALDVLQVSPNARQPMNTDTIKPCRIVEPPRIMQPPGWSQAQGDPDTVARQEARIGGIKGHAQAFRPECGRGGDGLIDSEYKPRTARSVVRKTVNRADDRDLSARKGFGHGAFQPCLSVEPCKPASEKKPGHRSVNRCQVSARAGSARIAQGHSGRVGNRWIARTPSTTAPANRIKVPSRTEGKYDAASPHPRGQAGLGGRP